MRKQNKYYNKKVTIDGIKFDSKKEALRYIYLKDMQKKGEISDLELQPSFTLQETFRYKGETHRGIKYKADFKYKDSHGNIIVEDTKGFKTPDYIIKKKLFIKMISQGIYTVEFREI